MRIPTAAFTLAAFTLVGGIGCAPSPQTLLEPDPARTGDFGSDGAFGARLLQRDLRVRGDRVVSVDVVAAVDSDDDLVRKAIPVLLVQGGSVPVERYHWLAQHLASRGAVVVAPHFLADLAFFDQADGSGALAALRERSRADDDDLKGTVDADLGALAVGHSLGGVVVAGAFESDRTIGAMALLASYPDPGSTPTRKDGRSLLIVGERDGLVNVDDVKAGTQALRSRTTTAEVAGLTHFQLTQDATAAEMKREGTTGEDLDVVRKRALFLLDALLADVGGNAGGGVVLDDDSRWPAGVEVLP